ncbi:MAG: hypothetical protein KME50_02615 [Nostoc desertorum CM1-VF14]|jgi:hypothetical protein|nr:hypothetical protein [Nostoc desertorum CM1-VF14]
MFLVCCVTRYGGFFLLLGCLLVILLALTAFFNELDYTTTHPHTSGSTPSFLPTGLKSWQGKPAVKIL